MLSNKAMNLMKHLGSLYQEHGKDTFRGNEYMYVPNYKEALEELIESGYITPANDVVGTITVNLDAIRN